jgi:5-methyltetrahydropteroyltriglutamate--homocysteine methyltransferase
VSMKIRTTHVGSLPGPPDFDPSAHGSDDHLQRAVQWVVDRQRSIGLDVINEGELTKGGDWLAFMDGRLGGFEERPAPAPGSIISRGRDREEFADFYRYAAERQTLFFTADRRMTTSRRYLACTAPITYTGTAALQRELAVFGSVVADPRDCFLTSTAPSSLEPYRSNEFYPTHEEFIFALAEALRAEYEAIVNAGFLLQIDDAWLVALWDRIGLGMGLAAFKRYCTLRVDALNHALLLRGRQRAARARISRLGGRRSARWEGPPARRRHPLDRFDRASNARRRAHSALRPIGWP